LCRRVCELVSHVSMSVFTVALEAVRSLKGMNISTVTSTLMRVSLSDEPAGRQINKRRGGVLSFEIIFEIITTRTSEYFIDKSMDETDRLDILHIYLEAARQ
jgi:hypothetical protein